MRNITLYSQCICCGLKSKVEQETHIAKMGTAVWPKILKMPLHFSNPICLPKPKSLGFSEKSSLRVSINVLGRDQKRNSFTNNFYFKSRCYNKIDIHEKLYTVDDKVMKKVVIERKMIQKEGQLLNCAYTDISARVFFLVNHQPVVIKNFPFFWQKKKRWLCLRTKLFSSHRHPLAIFSKQGFS